MLKGVPNRNELDQLPDNETSMMIPTDLATMKRRNGSTSDHEIVFMTRRISDIVVEVQQEKNWANNWKVLTMHFRDPDTRGSVGQLFGNMLQEKLQKDPSKMPPCFEMGD
jgi:hypothetical protein